jgi:tight adherence protein B
MMQWVPAIVAGFAVAFAAIGLGDWIADRFQLHVARAKSIAFRFTPETINAKAWVLGSYLASLTLLLVLLYLAPNPLFAFAIWAITLYLPNQLIEIAWRRRRQKIDGQFSAAIAVMCNCVKAGLTLVQSIQRLATSLPEPIRTEFRIMANRYAHGTDLEQTIGEARDRLKLQNFNLFASALLVNREMGGDVADTLDRISVSLEKLSQMRKNIEVHTAEGRMNIKILVAAPFVMLLLLYTVDNEGVSMLFHTPQGWCVLLVATALAGFGVFWASKIVHAEV